MLTRLLMLCAFMLSPAAFAQDTAPAQEPQPVQDTTLVDDGSSTPLEIVRPRVALHTNMGDIVVELYEDKAPKSVANFLQYVRDGHYDGTIFHRVIENFMVQGGGFTGDLQQKSTRAPIENEANNGLKNANYTVAMARTSVVDSATSQFFINLVDNAFLNHTNTTPSGYGYAVFGEVIEGMEVVDAIAAVPTNTVRGNQNVPVEPVVILSVKRR